MVLRTPCVAMHISENSFKNQLTLHKSTCTPLGGNLERNDVKYKVGDPKSIFPQCLLSISDGQ